MVWGSLGRCGGGVKRGGRGRGWRVYNGAAAQKPAIGRKARIPNELQRQSVLSYSGRSRAFRHGRLSGPPTVVCRRRHSRHSSARTYSLVSPAACAFSSRAPSTLPRAPLEIASRRGRRGWGTGWVRSAPMIAVPGCVIALIPPRRPAPTIPTATLTSNAVAALHARHAVRDGVRVSARASLLRGTPLPSTPVARTRRKCSRL